MKKLQILIMLLLVSAGTAAQDDEQPPFMLGLNYPWLNYAHDFGSTAWGHDGVSNADSAAQIEADFAEMQSYGVQVVRWFIFGDGRASPEFDANGMVTGFDEYFYADFDQALVIAEKYDIKLIPVLFDFLLATAKQEVSGVQLGGHAALLTNPDVQQSLFDEAISPLLERYGDHAAIAAWDVINEPEGAVQPPGENWVEEAVSLEVMQSFVSEMVAEIHTHASQPITLGSASRGWLVEWAESSLDFYQFHSYDHLEADYPLDYASTDLELDKPVIVGEFPTGGTSRSMSDYLDTIYANGYAGALAWSFRADDDASDFNNVSSEFAAWAAKHLD